jgi:CBS domain-containing protein
MSSMNDNVSEVMATQIDMVSDTIPMSFAANLMAEKHVHGLPVTTEEGELVGVLSWSDIVRALSTKPPVAQRDYFGPMGATVLLGDIPALDTLKGVVGDFMSTRLVAVGVDATVAQAAQMMRRGHVHRVLVVDDAGNLAGLVSAIDIVHHMADSIGEQDR